VGGIKMKSLKIVLPILVIVALVAVTGCTDTRTPCCGYGACNEKVKTSVVIDYTDFTGVYSAHFVDTDGLDYGIPLKLDINPRTYARHNLTFGYTCDDGKYVITRIIKDNSICCTCTAVVTPCTCGCSP
jgi:hypothetical protein